MLLLSLISIGWVGAMAVYLAFIEDGAYLFLGSCICVGMALYLLTNHGSFGYAAMIDLFGVSLTTAGVTAAAIHHSATQSMGVAIAIGGTAVLIYFLLCFRKMVLDRIALDESHMILAHDQKLRSLGQLTSGVAHDFNNLLTVVSGNIELALLQDATPEQRARLLEASHAAHRGAALVSQLLAYARKSSLNAQEVESNTVLAQVEEISQRVVPAGIMTEVDLSSPSSTLFVDAGLLGDGDPEPHRECPRCSRRSLRENLGAKHAAPRHGAFGHFCRDNGPGMDAITMERATEPFFTTKEPGKGTGLGLSMVRGFAEQSGGSLVLSNRLGGGLVASILLPALASDDPNAPSRSSVRPAGLG